MLVPFTVEMPVAAFLTARGRVATPRPDRCPTCETAGEMTFAGWWTRRTRHGPVDIHRVACRRCRATHSLWPDVLVGGRTDLAEPIGAALVAASTGMGHRPIAATLGVPAATARGWLRAARRRVTAALATRLIAWAAATGTGGPSWTPAGHGRLRLLVEAVGAAAAAWERLSGERWPPWQLAVTAAGGRLLG